LHPTTRLWFKIAAAAGEAIFLLMIILMLFGFVPGVIGMIGLALLLLERLIYIASGVGGYLSYRKSIKEAHRGESHHHRP
jgi:hypothetical protein